MNRQAHGVAIDMHGIAAPSVNRVAFDHGILSAVDDNAGAGAAINNIVADVGSAGDLDTDCVAVNSIKAERAARDQNAGAILVNIIGHSRRPIGRPEYVAPFQPDHVVMDSVAVNAGLGPRSDADFVAINIVEANHGAAAVQTDADRIGIYFVGLLRAEIRRPERPAAAEPDLVVMHLVFEDRRGRTLRINYNV